MNKTRQPGEDALGFRRIHALNAPWAEAIAPTLPSPEISPLAVPAYNHPSPKLWKPFRYLSGRGEIPTETGAAQHRATKKFFQRQSLNEPATSLLHRMSLDILSTHTDKDCHGADRAAFHVYSEHSGSLQKNRAYSVCLRRYALLFVRDGEQASVSSASTLIGEDDWLLSSCVWVFESSADPWSILAFDSATWMPGPFYDEDVRKLAAGTFLSVTHLIRPSWEQVKSAMTSHTATLEDFIYDNPAEDRLTTELWVVSKYLRMYDLLLQDHILFFEYIGGSLALTDLSSGRSSRPAKRPPGSSDSEVNEFKASAALLQHSHLKHIREGLNPSVSHLLDMIYKSAAIRDTQVSLKLNSSLWRLSWITFIFLPLTFVSGFFGMNVDVFKDNPSIGWYFLAAAVLMLVVLTCLIVVKQAAGQRWRPTRSELQKDKTHMV